MSKRWKKTGKPIKASKSPQRDQPRAFNLSAGITTIQAAEGETKLGTFDGNAYTGQQMRPSGWWTDIIIDLAGVQIPSQQRPVLRQHDHEQIAGHTTTVSAGPDGIKVAGVFSGEKHHVEKVTVPAKNGFQWQLSVGADPIRTEFLEAGESATVNGREVNGPLTISRETRLGEISFVPLGADGDTSVSVAASKGKAMNVFAIALKALMAEYRKPGSVHAAKYNDEQIDKMSVDEARAALRECSAADDDSDEDDSSVVDANAVPNFKAQADAVLADLRKNVAAEHTRHTGIAAAATRHGVSEIEITEGTTTRRVPIVAHAIAEGWTEDRTELAAIRAARPSAGVGVPGGLGYSTTAPGLTDAVLECAVFQAMGNQFQLFDADFYKHGENGQRRTSVREENRITNELKARYPDKVQQAAHTMFKSRIGFQQLLTTIAAAHGYRGPQSFRDQDGWGELSSHLQHRIQADSSTISISNTLANVQNKFMLQGYLFTEQAFADIAAIINVKDFKPTKSIALFGDFEFKDIGPTGEIEHASLADQAFANQASMKARMITIPLQHLINDDIGMLGQVPQVLGRGWGLMVNKKFWTLFLSPGYDEGGSTNFFAATHTLAAGQVGNSNYSSGGGSALNSAGLQAAKLLFDRQVDPVGNPLGLDAEILVYPPELDVAAIELMNAQFIVMAGLASTSAASKQPNTNIWKGRFKPVMSRYLSNSAYTGYSTTAWYLLANPSVMPCVQIAAWNGQMVPVVQTAGNDWQFNTLGISMRGYGAIGFAMQQFRGGVKSAGV